MAKSTAGDELTTKPSIDNAGTDELSTAKEKTAKVKEVKYEQSSEQKANTTKAATVPQKSNNNTVVYIVLGCIVLLCCCAAFFGGTIGILSAIDTETNDPDVIIDDVTDEDFPPAEDDIPQINYSSSDIGRAHKVGELVYTLNAIEVNGSTVILDVDVLNQGQFEKYFSAGSYMELYNADTDKKYFRDYSYRSPVNKNPDTRIEKNGKVNIKVGFSVASAPENLELVFKEGYFSREAYTVKLTKN